MSKGDGVEEQMMKDDNAEVILQESIQEASVNDFQNDLKDAEKSGREMSEVSEAEKRDETNNNDKSPDSTLQASLLKEQESLQTENLTAEAEEKDEDGSSIRKDEDEDNDNGLKEFKECSEKETLKGEEDVEQISPKNELGENLESSASMVSAETEEVALNKTTQETEEEMDEGVEGVKKEAETGKEDGEEQVIDENDAKSIPIESIKEVTVSKLLDDENNAEEFIREISEESVVAGTNESITDATYQNDGTTPDAAPETSSAKETLKDEEDVEQISPKNEPGENLERSASMISAETEEVALNKTTWKTEEEMDDGVEGVKKEAETGKEDGEKQVIDENDAKSIPVESIKEVPVSKLLNDENNAEEFIREISEESVAAGTNENITDATCQNDGTTPDAAPETSTAKETLKDEEDVEQIPPKNEPGENLERSASMIPAETEEVALNKTTWKTEEEIDEGVEGIKKEAETGKEDGEEQVIDENNAKSIPVESIKEVPVSKLLNDENNAEEFRKEISEESVAAGTNENITDATCQNDGTTPDAAPETSTAKETLKDKEHVEQIPPKNDPGENLESSASMIPAETEEVALNKTTQETEEEMNEGVEGVYKEAETGKEDGEEQVNEENDAKSIPVESIKEVTVSKLLDDENNAEEFKREISEESVAAGTNENITDMMYQNDGTTPNAALEASTAKETLKDEEDVEQISPMNEPGENLESSASMISAETEEVALNKTTRETEEEMDEGVEGVKKEVETGKEDGKEQVIDENNVKSIPIEPIKEVLVSKLLNDENNAEEFKREISEESVAIEKNESIIDETHQNDGTPNAALGTSTVKQVEIVQGEGKDTIPAEASPKEEEEHDRARGFKRVGDNSSEIRLEEDLEKSDEETSKKIDAVAHETNQHIEFPSSTLETSPVEEQASVQRDNLTPEETSPEEKIYEDGSSNKKDEDKGKNTGLAEETRNAGETLKAEESSEQNLQNDNLIENPKQSINMICAETEADAFSKMVDNHEEEIIEIPRGNAEAELFKEENIEVHVVEESNINSLSQESAEESPIKDFQNAAKNSEKATEEMLESQIAGGDETNTNDEDCNSSLPISVDKIDESFEGEDKNITTAEASTHDEKEEHGSLDRADDGNDSNRDLTVTNQDSTREALKVQEDSEQELQRIEPGELEESSTVMAAETEAGILSDKIDDVTSQEEVVTVPNIEETVEKEKKEEHGPLDRAGEGNDCNPDLTVTNQDSAREASKVQEDSEQELQRIEPGELEESSTVMAAETEAGTLSDKIDDVTSQEEVVTIENIEETVEKEKKEEHGPLDRADDGNDSNPDLTVTDLDSAREALKVQEDSEQELQRIEPGEPEESSTVMAAESEAGTLSDKIDDVTSQEEVVTVPNIEETVETEKKEEHGPLDKAGEGNDSNPDLTVTNQDSAREASKVQEDSEQELLRIEPGEPEESSTVMAAETKAGTLSDKIDDVTSQEEVATIQNIEETVEKEKKEEHGPLDRAGDGNDSNPDPTVTNQDSAREASKVQEDSEQELQRIEPGELQESSTVMAAETETGTLSDKIDDVTSQEEVVTVPNIEETVENEKKEVHGSMDKAGEGNDSNPDLTVTNHDSAREASKVQEDSEQELQRIEPGEPEESSTVMAAETEAGTLSDKIDDVTSQEEVATIENIEETVQEDSEQELQRIEPGEPEESSTVMAAETEAGTLSDKIDDVTSQEEVATIENIEETVEKEKKEGSEDIDVTKVKRAVMEEDLKLVAEASDANKSVENDAEDENIISGGKEVETVEKKFELDSIQKLEVEEKRENKEEEAKNEDIKEVCGDTKLASLSVDAEKHVTAEEHTNTDISPQTTGETTAEEKAETVKEMEESVITSVDEDAEKKVPEEESESAINDQSKIIYKGDESGMLVEQEVHEIIQTAEEYGDIGKQGSVIKDSYEAPLSSTNEEIPLHEETEDESDKVKPNEEVKDSKSEFTEPFEARGSVDRQEFETLRGEQGPNNDIYLVKASEGVSEKESSKSPVEISYLESESKGEILEEVQPDVNDSSSALTTGITRETSFKEAEPEDKRQIESFEPAPQEKGPVTESTERTTLESVDIDAKPEDSNFIENEDHGIPAASEAEELENEMHEETPITGSEDYKEETTNETSLDNVLDDKQVECSTILPKEPELMANEGNKATDENSTTYENIETPQTPQEIEIMLKEDMPINARDASKSVDPRIESIKEEVGSYQFDNLNQHHELDNEKQEGIDISKSSEVRDLANQGEICKLMSLEDEYSSNVGDEALKCIEATSAERKEAILEEDNSTKKSEDSFTDNVEANKAAFELEEGTNNQEQAIGTKDYGVLAEENFVVSESGKKLEGVSESETGDQSSQKIPETDPGKVENITEIQNRSLKSVEQSSLESQEVREETGEKTEPRFETEGDVKETQNTDETVKDVLLTEEVHEKVDKAGSETLKCTEKDVNDTLELCAKSTEDERVHEVKQSSLIAEECHEATESNEQTAIMSSDLQEAPTMEEMSLAKAINDEDNEMPAVLSTTKTAEELDEMVKIIKEEDSCRDKIKATTMVEIAKTSLEEAQLDEKPVQVSNITSNDTVSLEIEAEACQQEKIKDNVGLELPSNLASPILDDHENIMREQVAKENADADDVQENERASDVVYESKDHGIEELVTRKIKEENEKSSEIESLGVEAAANEIAIDHNPPEVISTEEQGISATTERREENVKDVELLEDDLRKTEEVPLQMDDCRERDISQLELQSNKDIQNQSPKEVLEEECGTPDETKEEIKEGPKLVSMTSSQGFEALKEDESTSGQTVPEEKLEEQNQTPAAALLSKEKDCGTERILENIEECVQVEIPTDPQNDSPKKITEDTCLLKEETNELEVSGFGVELNTGMQKDSLNEVQVEESKSPDDASKLQTPDYETSKEAFESISEAHGDKGFTASEETEIKEKHPEVAITDLTAGEDRSEKIIDPAEIIHDEVIEEGTFERATNLKTELSKEAFKSISEVHGHEALAESEDTEIKEKHPEVTVTDMAAEENQSERTIDATEIIHNKLKSEEITKREDQEIMEEKEGAKNGDPVTLVEETTKECQEENELKAEESLGDEGTQKDIQNEELYKEAEKADGIEKQMDTERIIEHLHLAAAENETMKESFLDEAGSELHLENQICEIASGNDGRTEDANVKEEEMDVEISQKEVPTDLVEANEATRDIHEEEETSKTTTEHIEEHVKEVEIEVDEHPSAPKTTQNTCSQKEQTKEQEVCGSGVECSTDMQKNGSNEFDGEEGRTPDEDSTPQPQGYENKIKDKEYLPESNKMTEITETGAFEKTSDLRAETGEEAFKSVSEVHEHEVLAESEHPEIKKEKHTEVAVTDLVAGENQNKKTIAATEVVHDEELTKQDKQQFKEEEEDTKNCNPINLGEETTKESRQIHDLKAEESQEDKMENEIQNEEVSNESGEYLHQTAVENETINESFPDEALVENAEDIGTKLQVEKHSDEKTSGYDRTEAITNEEFGTEISEKESLQAPAEANETTQDIHQGERDSDSTSEKPIPIEAEPQETTERKKDAPQVLLQEPIVEATQGAGVGESEPGKATGIVDAQGFERKAERSIDEENIRGNDESMSAKTSLFDMMQSSTRERQVGGELTEETRVEGEKAKSDEEKEEEEEGEEHKKTDSGSDAPVMVEASRDIVDVKVASKKHYNILSGVGSKVKSSISKVKKAITGKSSHPKQHSPK
ncbi:hypothetical protein NC651_003468 [Populus alba x Populus x berolinensis]|nr:hypothetical protein NC651_003468 [Populus alba x Populus x berolinensis]